MTTSMRVHNIIVTYTENGGSSIIISDYSSVDQSEKRLLHSHNNILRNPSHQCVRRTLPVKSIVVVVSKDAVVHRQCRQRGCSCAATGAAMAARATAAATVDAVPRNRWGVDTGGHLPCATADAADAAAAATKYARSVSVSRVRTAATGASVVSVFVCVHTSPRSWSRSVGVKWPCRDVFIIFFLSAATAAVESDFFRFSPLHLRKIVFRKCHTTRFFDRFMHYPSVFLSCDASVAVDRSAAATAATAAPASSVHSKSCFRCAVPHHS